MKKIRISLLTMVIAAGMSLFSCGPSDNKGGMDQENSKGEGAIDSTRLPNFDSTSGPIGMDTTTAQ